MPQSLAIRVFSVVLRVLCSSRPHGPIRPSNRPWPCLPNLVFQPSVSYYLCNIRIIYDIFLLPMISYMIWSCQKRQEHGPTLSPFPRCQDPEPRSGLSHVGCEGRGHVSEGPLVRNKGRSRLPALWRARRLRGPPQERL